MREIYKTDTVTNYVLLFSTFVILDQRMIKSLFEHNERSFCKHFLKENNKASVYSSLCSIFISFYNRKCKQTAKNIKILSIYFTLSHHFILQFSKDFKGFQQFFEHRNNPCIYAGYMGILIKKIFFFQQNISILIFVGQKMRKFRTFFNLFPITRKL